jgi:hypothetical protein
VLRFPGAAHPLSAVPVDEVARQLGRWADALRDGPSAG